MSSFDGIVLSGMLPVDDRSPHVLTRLDARAFSAEFFIKQVPKEPPRPSAL